MTWLTLLLFILSTRSGGVCLQLLITVNISAHSPEDTGVTLNSLVPGDAQETITILLDSRNSEHGQKWEGDLYLLVT